SHQPLHVEWRNSKRVSPGLGRAAIEGAAKARGLPVIFRAEPAIRPGQAGVARAALQKIDADIAGHASAGRELALDGAASWHREILGKQRLADLPIAIGATCPAAQRAVPLSLAEILRRDEAAFPEAEASIPGFRFIVQEAAFGRRLEIHRKT